MKKSFRLISIILSVLMMFGMLNIGIVSASALSEGEIYTVAGAGGLCGSEWDPADTNNLMTWNADEGVYEIEYTNVAAGYYEFKVVKDLDWDASGNWNLDGDAMYGGANAYVNVETDGSTVVIGFNGMHAYTEVYTDTTEDNTSSEDDIPATSDDYTENTTSSEHENPETGIKVGDNVYDVAVGDTITYMVDVTAARLFENFQLYVSYDSNALEIVRYPSDDPDYEDWKNETDTIVPNIRYSGGAVANLGIDGIVKANASKVAGYNFKEEATLLTLEFVVLNTAYSEIDLVIEYMTIKGGNESYFDDGEAVITDGIAIDEYLIIPEQSATTETKNSESSEATVPTENTVSTESTEEDTTEVVDDTTATEDTTIVYETGIKVGDNVYDVAVGDTITYMVDVTAARLFENFQLYVSYDSTALEIVRYPSDDPYYEDWKNETDTIVPNIRYSGGAVANLGIDGIVKANASKIAGYNFKEEATLLTLEFVVLDTAYSEIDLVMEEMTIKGGDESYYANGEAVITDGIAIDEYLIIPEQSETTEVTTVTDPAEEKPARSEASCEVKRGDEVTYTFRLTTPRNIENVQATVFYDSSKLELQEITPRTAFPVLRRVIYNDRLDGMIKFNASEGLDEGFDFTEGGILVTLTFNAISDGNATVGTTIEEMCEFITSSSYVADCKLVNDNVCIASNVVVKSEDAEATDPVEETTSTDTIVVPEETVPDGSESIENTENVADTEYTDATEEDTTAVEDDTTAVEDDATAVEDDTTAVEDDTTATAEDTTAEDVSKAGVIVDGAIYNVAVGEEITYVVDLTADELLDNIYATVSYDSSVLELVRYKSDDPDIYDWEIEGPIACPNLSGVIFNAGIDNIVKLSAYKFAGYDFREGANLVTLKFIVKADALTTISLVIDEMTSVGGEETYFTDGKAVVTDGIIIDEYLGGMVPGEEIATVPTTEAIYLDNKTQISVEPVEGTVDIEIELVVEEISSDKQIEDIDIVLVGEKVGKVFDITLVKDGEEIQPDGAVKVKIPTDNSASKVYRFETDGSLTDMNATYEDGYMVFTTDHFSLYVLAVVGTSYDGLLGDVNGDGVVNVRDATTIQKYIAGLTELSDEALAVADFNIDGNVNVKDATAIQKKIAGLI